MNTVKTQTGTERPMSEQAKLLQDLYYQYFEPNTPEQDPEFFEPFGLVDYDVHTTTDVNTTV